jgi:hypothetical protein
MKSGSLVTLTVLIPNLILLFIPPTELPQTAAGSKTFFGLLIQILERIGQVGVFLIPFFYQIELQGKIGVLALALVALAVYYAGWLRYIIHGRAFKLLFSPLFGIPLPMAVSPVAYFGAWSVLFDSLPLAAATAILAVGHIGVSNKERQRSS